MNMKKIEKKLSKLEEQKLKKSSAKLDKKIMKLKKKKAKLEKWLKIKLPFRILIKGAAAWLIIGGVCYGCSYVPILRELKIATTGALAYVAPEPVTKVLDVVTLNLGVNNNDFEWLKATLKSYINGEIELNRNNNIEINNSYNSIYAIELEQVPEDSLLQEAELEKMLMEQREKDEELYGIVEETLGTSINDIQSMSISEILIKVATNSTPELVSTVLDMLNLTPESKQRVEQDVNRALKIIPKLNNNQMNELVNLITNMQQASNKQAEDAANQFQQQVELEQQRMEELLNQLN